MPTIRRHLRADRAELLYDAEPGTTLQLHVPSGANTVTVAGTREALDTPTGTGAVGIPITNVTGPLELTWTGELWGIASANNTPFDLNAP